jgi:hypothetical protein
MKTHAGSDPIFAFAASMAVIFDAGCATEPQRAIASEKSLNIDRSLWHQSVIAVGRFDSQCRNSCRDPCFALSGSPKIVCGTAVADYG